MKKNMSKKNVTREEALQAFNSLRKHAKKNGLSKITLDKINKEIHAVRKSK